MLRVRGFTQDDAHIFCTPAQLADEIAGVIRLVHEVLTTFGFDYTADRAAQHALSGDLEVVRLRSSRGVRAGGRKSAERLDGKPSTSSPGWHRIGLHGSPRADPTMEEPDPQPKTCLNCGEVQDASAAFCPACGQAAGTRRLDIAATAREAAGDVSGFDSPLLRTLRGMLLRPGQMIAEYVDGRRQQYSRPVNFCLLMVAVSVFSEWLSRSLRKDEPDPEKVIANEHLQKIEAFIASPVFSQVVILLLLPVLALMLTWSFRGKGRNFSEWLTFTFFVYGQVFLYAALLVPFGGMDQAPTFVLSFVIPFTLLSWAAMEFTRTGLLRGAVVSFLVHVLYYAVVAVLAMLVVAAVLYASQG